MKMTFVTRTLAAGFLLICAEAAGQTPPTPSSMTFNVDVARFRYSATQTYLEVYYGIQPISLTYRKEGEMYAGAARVRTRVVRAGDTTAAVDYRMTIPVVHRGSKDPGYYQTLVGQYGCVLDNGRYTLVVVVTDSLTPRRMDSVTVPIECSPFVSSPSASDLELCSRIEASTNTGDLFYKNRLEVQPNPTMVFGATLHPVVFAYLELYELSLESSFTVRSWITDASGSVLKLRQKPGQYASRNAAEVVSTNVAQLPSGKYQYHVALLDRDSSVAVSTSKTFFTYNPHVRQKIAEEAVSAKAAELIGMSVDELKDEFRKVMYFATDEEKKLFESMGTAEGIRNLLATLWAALERGRGDWPPMFRSVYLQRVADANERYGSAMKRAGAGWATDRGRIFLMYGEPDEIERVPSTGDKKPYETWHYYEVENGVYFIFIDRSGFGDMMLVSSTKRGELQDTEWQRYLQ